MARFLVGYGAGRVGDSPRVCVDVRAACKAEKEKEWRELLGRLPDRLISREGKAVHFIYSVERKMEKRFTMTG